MEYLVVSVLNGVVHGLLLFMVSAGLTLIFGMMGVLNFAHAWFYMLGAYVGLHALRARLGFWAGLIAAPIIAGVGGVLVERYMLRRVHKYGHAHELLLTFGLAFIIEEVIKLFYGDFPVNYAMPPYMKFAAFTHLRDELSLLPPVHGRRRPRHVRGALRAADAHPRRHHRAGRHLPAGDGRGARPQSADGLHGRLRGRRGAGRARRRRGRRVLPDRARTWRSTSARWCSWWSWSAGSARSRARWSPR